jgi:hypothetical protein
MSNTNKTSKKSIVTIDWPTSHFTIDDVQSKYPNVVNITLRFRVKKATENKEIVTIGKIKPAIGRPKLVFARANPSKELLEAAKAAGVIAVETRAAVAVAEVKAEKPSKVTIPTNKDVATHNTTVTNS